MKYPTLRFVFDRRKIATNEKKASVYLEVAFARERRGSPRIVVEFEKKG